MTYISGLLTSLLLGLLAPLTAVCIIPLYPGFLSFLAGKAHHARDRKTIFYLGLIVASGIISFMLLFGIIFTTILEKALSDVIGIISPIAFGLLGIISILLIFNYDFSKFFPNIQAPITKSPQRSAYTFGFFFGAIIIPCNPGIIGFFLARQFLENDFLGGILNFFAFGIGISAPLVVFAAASARWDKKVIGFLTRHKKAINITAGVIMLYISLYYLFCNFAVQDLLPFPTGPIDDWFCDFNQKFLVGPFVEFFGRFVP